MFATHGAPVASPWPGTGAFSSLRVVAGLVLLFLSRVCWASLVINEFLPDPDGSDGGREFVEILNTGAEPVSLDGLWLQFANGAEIADWVTRWTGTAGSSLGAGERFLIVDRNWMGDPAGQAEVYLGLQNGPDALRLARAEGVLDLVGYGPLTDPDMMETDPAAIVSGRSLARRPDGNDTGNNALDFVLAEPTPGAPNFKPFSLEVIAWELDPPTLDRVAMRVRFTLKILNNGTGTFPVGPMLLRVGQEDHPALLDQTPPDRERSISWIFEPSCLGLLPLEVLSPVPGSQDSLVLEPATLQVGPAELILNEVLAAPRQGQGEWVEVATNGGGQVDLTGYSLRDEDGSLHPLPSLILAPGEFLVLSQDSLALARWNMDNQANGSPVGCGAGADLSAPRNLAGWPTLNNTPPEDRNFADRVYLVGPRGNVRDHLTLGDPGAMIGGQSEPGLSLERLAPSPPNPGASNWAPCTALTGSTPGCPNSVAAVGEIPTGFAVTPRIMDRAAGVSTIHFLFELTREQTGWELRVFDLWGGLVRDLGGENLGAGSRDLMWDGRDDQGRSAVPGGYIVLLEILDRNFNRLAREKALLVIR